MSAFKSLGWRCISGWLLWSTFSRSSYVLRFGIWLILWGDLKRAQTCASAILRCNSRVQLAHGSKGKAYSANNSINFAIWRELGYRRGRRDPRQCIAYILGRRRTLRFRVTNRGAAPDLKETAKCKAALHPQTALQRVEQPCRTEPCVRSVRLRIRTLGADINARTN